MAGYYEGMGMRYEELRADDFWIPLDVLLEGIEIEDEEEEGDAA